MKFNKYILGLAAAAVFALTLPVAAQTPIPVKVYACTNPPASWLTNSSGVYTNVIAITNGYLQLSSNCTYIVQSQPFPLWRGRGFAFNTQFADTNGNSATLTFHFRFATVHPAPWGGTTLVTNWNTTPLVNIAQAGNGTTVVNLATNIPPTVCDNFQLGQLYSIDVSLIATAVNLDPTNTFVSADP